MFETILPLEIGGAEPKWFGGVLHRGVVIRIGRRRQSFGARDIRPRGRELALAMQIGHVDRERPVGRGRQDHQRGPSAGEVAEDEVAIFITAGQRAGVSIHPQNRGGDIRTRSSAER